VNTPDAVVSRGKGDTLKSREELTMPIDDKLFNSEVRRLDSDISNVKKSQEKFETKVETAIYDLRQDMKDLRAEFNVKI
jgi:hypothetical protein